MSSTIKGVRELDKAFTNMMAVKLACDKAGISYPTELLKYFGDDCAEESEEYLCQEMEIVDVSAAIQEHDSYYEVELARLPEGIKAIRFENIW